jgi:hypothetical protein
MAYGEERYGAPNSGKAIAALICGIVGLTSCGLVGIVAIVLGNQALREIAASGGRVEGEGLARAGVVMGWISVALMALGVAVLAIVLVVVGTTS